MITVGLWVRLIAKPGKEATVAEFLEGAVKLAEQETGTVLWCAVRLSPTEFAIFDGHTDEAGRQAHLNGEVAAAILANAGDWLAEPPVIEQTDFLALKLPA